MSSLWKPSKLSDYLELQRWIDSVRDRSVSEWEEVMRWYVKNDLFYFLNFVATDGQVKHSQTGERFHFHQYYLDMCRSYEYQKSVGGGIDVSGRGSAKSTVRTKLGSIQLLLNYPDVTIFIFSVQKNLSQKHLRIIKDELEKNKLLKILFEDVLFDDPHQAVKDGKTIWSIEDGIRVKRTMLRTSQTVEAHAFFGGGPVGTRPDCIHCDDIEHSGVVTTAENIKKLEDSYSNAVTLLTPVAIQKALLFITNTRFSEAGLIQHKLDEYMARDPGRCRGIPGELLREEYESRFAPLPQEYMMDDGECPLMGEAVYPYTSELLQDKYRETHNKNEYALQIALSYTAAEDTSLSESNIQWAEEDPATLAKDKNVYICIDASRGVRDPTGIWVWGLGADRRFYWLDGLNKKMDPSKPEFHNNIFMMVSKWANLSNRVVEIRVEQMGGSLWADLVRNELKQRGCYVPVIACTSVVPRTEFRTYGSGKLERIFQRWSPMLSNGLCVFPKRKSQGGPGIINQDDNGTFRDLVEAFLANELKAFPRSKHDDMLDAGALIHDNKANEERPLQWPSAITDRKKFIRPVRRMFSWMSGG